MTRAEAARVLREIVDEIYDKLDEMEAILEEVSLEEFALARAHWMAYVDGALLNRNRWLGGSIISLKDTLATLEEE